MASRRVGSNVLKKNRGTQVWKEVVEGMGWRCWKKEGHGDRCGGGGEMKRGAAKQRQETAIVRV